MEQKLRGWYTYLGEATNQLEEKISSIYKERIQNNVERHSYEKFKRHPYSTFNGNTYPFGVEDCVDNQAIFRGAA
jgi:hypothetical protein